MLRVLFVIPPYRTTDVLTNQLYPMPLAAVTLAAVLRQAGGFEVEIKDFLLPRQTLKTAPPDSFAGKAAPPYLHFGLALEDCLAWLDANIQRFDVVGLCMGQCNIWETGSAIGQHLKGRIPVVIGGPFASTATEQALEMTGAQIAVKNEGENVVVEAMQKAVAGWTGIIQGTLADVEALPLPAWDLAPPVNYPTYEGRARGVLCISRGCPWDCSFCSVFTIMSRKHRRMTGPRLRAEIMNLFNAGVRYFSFLDDNLFISPAAIDLILGTLEELRASVPGFSKCRYYVEEGIEIRVASMPGLLKKIVSAGFDNVALGMETTNAAQAKANKKPYNAVQLQQAVKEAEQAGAVCKAFYIIGFPNDTMESVCADLVEFGRYGLAARPNNLKVYPGTATQQAFLAAGAIDETYDWRLSSFWTPNVPGGLLYKEIKQLKTALGAIGRAADTFGMRLFADSKAEALAKINATKGWSAKEEGGVLLIHGHMFRSTQYRHMAAMLLLAWGAAGASVEEPEPDHIVARPLGVPASPIQAAIVKACGREALGQQSLAM